MKYIPLFFALIILLATFTACDNSAPANSSPAVTTATAPSASFPKEEAEKLIKRLATQDGCKDSTAEMRLSFMDSDGKPQQMDFRLQRKYEGSKISTLMTILAPKEESEKALLAFEEEGKPTDAISYLAGLKKVAHLNSSNPLNFRGSKSSVQEMLGLELGKYEIASAERDKDHSPFKIILAEKKEANSSFPRIVINFKASSIADFQDATHPMGSLPSSVGYNPESFELYDAKDQLVKQMKITKVENIKGNTGLYHQTIGLLEIEDIQHNQKLKLETRNIKYDTNLPASIFTEAQLIKAVTAATAKLIQ